MPGSITLSPFYHSAVNEITKPDSLVFVSRYFARRWMRELGPLGTAIVVCLRLQCYQNRKTGELRNLIQMRAQDIADELGVSDKTVRRELERNRTLGRFVMVQREFAGGPTPGSLRRDAHTYRVAMDDPLHPLDEPELREAVREKMAAMEKGGASEPRGDDDAKARARARQQPSGQIDRTAPRGPLGQIVQTAPSMGKPSGQIDRTASPKPLGQIDRTANGLDKMTEPMDKLSNRLDKLSSQTGQIVQTLIESFSFPENPLYPLRKFSLSLFPDGGEEGTGGRADPAETGPPAPDGTAPPPPDVFPETERPAWEEKARQFFVLNGVPSPGARAVARQAVELWRKSGRPPAG